MRKNASLILLLTALITFAVKLTVVTDIDYPPFTYIDQEGKLVGISVKIWELFSQRTGVEVELIPMNWQDAMEMAREKKTDVIDLIFVTEERRKFLDYSISVYKLTSSIYYDENLPTLKDLQDLTPYVVGVKKGDALYEVAKNENPKIQFRFYNTYGELFLALENHEVEVVLMDDIPAQYYLHRYDLVYRVKKSPPFTENNLHWAVPKGKEAVLNLLDNGLQKISPKEISQIVDSMIPSAGIDPSVLRFLWLTIAILSGSIFVLLLFNRILKMMVKRATAELERNNEQLKSYNEELEAQSEEIKAMNEELEKTINELDKTNQRFVNTLKLINDAFDLQEDGEKFLKKAFDVMIDMFPNIDLANISLFDNQIWKVIEAKGFDKNSINALKIPSSQLYIPNEPVLIKEIRELDKKRMSGEIFSKIERIIPRPLNSMILPMKVGEQTVGAIVLETTQESNRAFTEHDLMIAKAMARIVTSFFVVGRFVKFQERLSREIVSMLVKALEYYDRYTQGHSQRVAQLCVKIAQRMGLSESELELAALLHDVGKIYIPQGVLNKEGRLTNEEFDLVKQHPVKGFELINSISGMEKIAKIVLYHHERYDGKGYPVGLKDGEIPVESQVIFVADSFDAMTTPRPYRKTPMSVEEAIKEIENCSSTQFNPDVVKVFTEILLCEKE